MIVLGLSAGLIAAFAAAAPPLLLEAVAGLALLGALRARSPRPRRPRSTATPAS